MRGLTVPFVSTLLFLSFFLSANAFSEEPLKIIAGPYLMDFDQTRMTVMWETNLPAPSKVLYGEEAPLTSEIARPEPATIHEVVLEGLKPETSYYYQILSTDSAGKEVTAEVATFMTAVHPDTAFAYCVMGDHRTYPDRYEKIADLAYAERPNFVINVGDVVSNGTVKQQWIDEFLFPARKLMARVPTYISIGNHEKNADWYYKYVSYPKPENYYSFDFGNSHFTIVDSNQPLVPGQDQYKWIEQDLAQSNATWKFVVHHHPPYSSDENDYGDTVKKFEKTDRGEVDMREVTKLYDKYDVDLVWVGHIHDYERTWPLTDGKVDQENGVIYIQTGGGGAELENFAPTRSWFTAKVFRGWQFCSVAIHGKTLRMMAYDIDGKMYDYLDLAK